MRGPMSPPRAFSLAPALALALGCATTRSCHSMSPDLGEIERLEDQRSLGAGRLVALATSTDAAVRARAMVALGRIQDPSAVPTIEQGLKDADSVVRDRAAFAAGLLGMAWVPLPDASRDQLAAAVAAADKAHPKDGTRRSFIDALARLGGAASQDHLVSVVREEGAGDDRLPRAIVGLALIAKRDGKMADAPLEAVLQRWDDAKLRPSLRWALAYALALGKSPKVRTQAVDCVKHGMGLASRIEEVEQAAALCARALTEAGKEEDVALLKSALGHRDYRVASEATRTLVRFAQRAKDDQGRATAAVAALGDLVEKVDLLARGEVAAGAQPLLQLAKLDLPDEAQWVLSALRQKLQAQQAAASDKVALDLARIDCRLAASQDRHQAVVSQVLTCGAKLLPEPWRLALALGQMDHAPRAVAPSAAPFSSYLTHASPTVRSAALGAIAAAKDQSAQAAVRVMVGNFTPGLNNGDPVVAASAAAAAAALGDQAAIPGIVQLAGLVTAHPDFAEPLAAALVELKAPEARDLLGGWRAHPHAHVRNVAALYLAKLGVPVPAATPPAAQAADSTPAPEGASLRFQTAKGDFAVKLDTKDNPRTSANLWALARKGYFDGLTFHRVEPDFVVQGGDPRGDGEGGPGYSIRCEVSDRLYVRGTIGMALSGQDTGGSQFFFTTADHPHLEGRYTAFGEVTKGTGVLDDLMEGEAITRVTASP